MSLILHTNPCQCHFHGISSQRRAAPSTGRSRMSSLFLPAAGGSHNYQDLRKQTWLWFWNDRSSAGRCHERGMIFITCNPLHRHMSSFLVISTPRFRPHVERQTPWPFALTFSLGFGPCGEQHQRSTGVSRVTFDCHHTFVVSQSEEMLVSPSTSSVSSSLFISLNVHSYRSF